MIPNYVCEFTATLRRVAALILCLVAGPWALRHGSARSDGQRQLVVQSETGLRLSVDEGNTDPAVRLALPGRSASGSSIEILFPEHVTVMAHGGASGHLYLFRPGRSARRPDWRKAGSSLEYDRQLAHGIRLRARATLEDDGVRFTYSFVGDSVTRWDRIYAVTDPRLTGVFHDVRLERTYVHHPEGFDLLAGETPERRTMPLDRWLPVRCLASYTWLVPAQRVESRDGIKRITASRPVDEPLIATVARSGGWIIASFARDPGNVWTNPELTCQHVDPQRPLAVGAESVMEVKLLAVQGSLDDVLRLERLQRASLR